MMFELLCVVGSLGALHFRERSRRQKSSQGRITKQAWTKESRSSSSGNHYTLNSPERNTFDQTRYSAYLGTQRTGPFLACLVMNFFTVLTSFLETQVVLLGSAPDPRIQNDFVNLANQLHSTHGDRARLVLTYDEPLSHLVNKKNLQNLCFTTLLGLTLFVFYFFRSMLGLTLFLYRQYLSRVD